MDIIVKAVAGSHLFGLNTPKSDKDFKGVYLPPADDIILGKIKTSVHQSTNPGDTKNGANDVDVEFYSLDKFYKMLQQGQTVALELLFTPEEFIIEKSPIWDEIVANRDKLVHKGVGAFIGYAKQQAAKYGIRGSRMGTLENAIEMLREGLDDTYCVFMLVDEKIERTPRLEHIWKDVVLFCKQHEHTSIMKLPVNKNITNEIRDHWEILGKKFETSCKIDYVLEILETIYEGYGERSKQAKQNEGIDFKAVSHALRVCHQGKELFKTGKITLPLVGPEKDFILDVKSGELDFVTEVQPVLEQWMLDLQLEQKNSILHEGIEVDQYILDFYRRRVHGII